jgi:thioredoxin reductase (NADPH)
MPGLSFIATYPCRMHDASGASPALSPAAVDVAIIGAGPIGIELAVALKHAGVRFALIDAGNVGSTFMWWAPGTRFFSSPERIAIAGVPLVTINQEKATREEYLAYLRGIVQQFDLSVMSGTRVKQIEPIGPAFALQCGGLVDSIVREVRAQRLILAIGNMHRPRLIDVPGENLAHISHYLADPHLYFGRRVLIVGGKNSAVEAAIRLYRIGARVTLSYRGEAFDPKRVKYWLRPELEWLIHKGRIAFHPRTLVQAIDGDRVQLCSIDDPAAIREVQVDDVLLLTGYLQDTMLFEQLGIDLECDERAPKHDLHTMQTNVAGVYVAGTAAGGSQKRARLFIENTHVHVQRIVRDIAGVDVPWKVEGDYAALQES